MTNVAVHRRIAYGCLLVLVVTVGGCSRRPTIASVRALVKAGKLVSGCDQAGVLVRHGGETGARLAAMRCWIDCLEQAGDLARAARWLDQQSASAGVTLYGRALLALATSPAKLPRSLELFSQAARALPQEAEVPYRAGIVLLGDDQAAAAMPLLERACHLQDSAACRVALAHAQLDLDNTQKAIGHVSKVLMLDPRLADIERGRALIGRLARRRRQLPQVIRPRFREALENLVKRDRPALAMSAMRELIVDYPNLASLHTVSGLAALRLGANADAIVALRRAIELDRDDPANHLYLASIYRSSGRIEQAVKAYRHALRCDPFHRQAALELGELLQQLKRPKKAAEILDRLVLLDGGKHRSLRMAGRAHLAAGAPGSASRHFSRLLTQEPEDFEAHLRMAQSILEQLSAGQAGGQGMLERARHHTKKAAGTRPEDPEVKRLQQEIERSYRR